MIILSKHYKYEDKYRLYAFRMYKKQIERDVEIAKEFQDGNQSD